MTDQLRENTLAAVEKLEAAQQAVINATHAEYPPGTVLRAKLGKSTIIARVAFHRERPSRPAEIVVINIKTGAQREINAASPEFFAIEVIERP